MRPSFMPVDKLGKGFKWLLGIHVVVFILYKATGDFGFIDQYLLLETKEPNFWQAFTYMFIHANGMHLFGNTLGLFFFGSMVEQQMGTRTFIRFYLICGIGAAIISYLYFIPFEDGARVLGASGCLYGVLYACYRFFPDQTVLLFFTLPIKIKYLILGFGIMDFIMMFQPGSNVAHYAHLGGLIVAWGYFRYGDYALAWVNTMKKKKQIKEEIQDANIKEQVDQILEKISREGMGALTDKEKNLLKQASKRYQKD